MGWRDDEWKRVSAMAGLDEDGGILPPPHGIGIDRSLVTWWRNRFQVTMPDASERRASASSPDLQSR